MKPPTIEVIIPTLDMGHLIHDAISSVHAQDYADTCITVVDNGSTDGTVPELRAAGIRTLVESTRGSGAARMRGVYGTKGPLVFFLDADDVLVDGALTKLASAITQRSSHPHLAYGLIANARLGPDAAASSAEPPRLAPLASNCLIRREAFDEFGPMGDDVYAWSHWVVTARAAGLVTSSVDQLIAIRRIHGDNVSLREGMSAALLRLAREHHSAKKQI